MASIKRKAVVADGPVKRTKSQPDSGRKASSATPKPNETPSTKPAKAVKANEQERNPVKASILQSDDRAFPRGGASVLTPLEHKQIKLDAERDVLFEQSGRSKPKSSEYSDDEEAGAGTNEDGSVPAKKRRKSKQRADGTPADSSAPGVRIQGLSFKNLVVGSLVLGQVNSITSRDVALALPNNLTGYIPLTAISSRLNTRIEALLEEDEKKPDTVAEDDEDLSDIDLKSLFHVGQFLRACVTSTAEESTVNGLRKSKKRIELSVDPHLANAGLVASDLAANNMIQAAIRSVEDHGLVMDLGLEDDTVRGFVSKKELGKDWEISTVQEGQVFLCSITGLASNGKVAKLCPDPSRMGDASKHALSNARTIDAFVPGTAVEVLVTDVTKGGIAGKIMGMLDATADLVHSGAGGRAEDLTSKYKIGTKINGRVLYVTTDAENKKVGVSLLDHIKLLQNPFTAGKKKPRTLKLSEIIKEAKVIQVEPAMGLFLDVGTPGRPGFAHISRVADKKIETLFETTGPYKVDSIHRARVLGFNPMDGVYNLSLEPSTIEQPFLRIEDVEVGQSVKGTVEKLILGAKGVTGAILKLAEGVTGLVPEMHFADVHLQHPEKKFREGLSVKARVLSVDSDKRQIRLTLKKTLCNTEAKVWKSYNDISVGDESPGTIINLRNNGAVVQFYGNVRAWLPVGEMSEAYIKDPTQHFRLGQTLTVHALSVDSKADELKVSCKDAGAFGETQAEAWANISVGKLVSATVTEITNDNVALELAESGLKATLRTSHLADGSEQKVQSALKQIRVGQKLADLVVLEKREKRHIAILSNKSSLVKASKSKTLLASFSSVSEGQEVHGFVRNITPDGVFVEFAGATVGYLPKTLITQDKLALPAFGLRKDQSISAKVLAVDQAQQRFTLTLKEPKKEETADASQNVTLEAVANPVDGSSTSIADFTLGKQTEVRIVSVKDTQLNVQLADNVHGRIDVSEVFENWEDIKDRKQPLQIYKPKQILSVKVLGLHDARNHRFLPITHRQTRVPVFELTAKTGTRLDSEADILTLDKLTVGSSWIAYVNNIADKCLWANISPNVRGRIDLMDLSDDVSLLQDLQENFPVGSAIRVRVKGTDISNNRLDLIATSQDVKAPKSLQDLTVGMTVPGKVTKVTDRAVIVALSDTLTGAITLTELADDFTEANTSDHNRNDILRVCIVDIDHSNKRVYLSLRPSKVLSSSLPVEDPPITTISQLTVNDVRRGFVKVVRDNGIVVNLGPRVDAFVRVSDLTDAFIKDWKSAFEVDQVVKGKILAVDAALNHVQLSLKASHVDKNYTPPTSFTNLKEGQIVTGKVRKVEDFGVFIDVDNTRPRVSGLCHRSQIADSKIADVRKLFDEGDAVKAIILSIDAEKRRISFGLKSSYFKDDASDDEMEDAESDEQGDLDDAADSDEESLGGIDLADVQDIISVGEGEASDDESEMSIDEPRPKSRNTGGLKTNGFDWTGDSLQASKTLPSDSEADNAAPRKRKRRAEIQVDRTGDLDAHGPRSTADFERLLLSSPNDSGLWIQYMAFQLRLSETQAARDIGQRALRTIHIRETDEKLAVWIALLNLEVSYGSEEDVERVFKEACAVQDPYIIHERLAEIWTQAGRLDNADKIYEAMIGTKAFRPATGLWLTYATFLLDKLDAAPRARALLSRALQSVHASEHRALTAKFSALEFKTKHGDAERGRTVFEGLVAEWPKWSQGWDTWVDLERGRIAAEGDEAKARVRSLFERMSRLKMKKRRARFVFKRWLEFEEAHGDAAGVERVKGLAKEYVEGLKGGDEEE